jgi:hypothetical protein
MSTTADTADTLAQFVAGAAELSALARDPELAARLGPTLAAQVQSVAAAVRQRFVAPPAQAA